MDFVGASGRYVVSGLIAGFGLEAWDMRVAHNLQGGYVLQLEEPQNTPVAMLVKNR